MIRGGNCEFRFNLPYAFSELATAQIHFWQDGYNGPTNDRPLPILKILEQCCQGSKPTELSVTLHQEETLRFTDKRKARAQLRAVTISGVPIISPEKLFTVYPAYNDAVLDEDVWPTPDYNGWVVFDGKTVAEEAE
jgi:hypothetical protein